MTRSDAARNRATLLRAAEAVFTEFGATAPLALVVDRSDLGRGTLYRHFNDRPSLVSGIYGARLERYAAHAAQHADDPDVLFQLLRMTAWDQFAIPGLFRIIHTDPDASGHVADLWVRTAEVFEPPLRASQAARTVRDDLTIDDVFLVIAMLYGVANSPSADRQGPPAIERALSLVSRILA